MLRSGQFPSDPAACGNPALLLFSSINHRGLGRQVNRTSNSWTTGSRPARSSWSEMSRKERNVRLYLLVIGLVSSVLFVVAMVHAADKTFATQSGLKVEMIQEGTGPKPQAGQTVSVHYVGTLPDGTKFDSSRDRGEPISFKLGVGQVIRGWDEGIALLNVGSRAKLTIPSELGYGARGAGNVIPPNSTLIFDVELMAVK